MLLKATVSYVHQVVYGEVVKSHQVASSLVHVAVQTFRTHRTLNALGRKILAYAARVP